MISFLGLYVTTISRAYQISLKTMIGIVIIIEGRDYRDRIHYLIRRNYLLLARFFCRFTLERVSNTY